MHLSNGKAIFLVIFVKVLTIPAYDIYSYIFLSMVKEEEL